MRTSHPVGGWGGGEGACLQLPIFSSLLSLFECAFLPSFSHLEEDPLYIAYADMMAKVRSMNPYFSKTCQDFVLKVDLCALRAVQRTRRKKRKKKKKKRLR